MSPAYFLRSPNWRSAVLAVVFTLPWLILLGRGWLRRPAFWLAVLFGAIVFAFSIAWVQVPIQNALNRFWLSVLQVGQIQRYLLLVGIPSIAVTGIVQEAFKFAVGVLALLGLRRVRVARAGLAMGAAAGAGLGGLEAFWVFNTIFASGFTWATVQLGGAQALLGFIERLFTVPFHIGAAALSVYGFATRRPVRFLLLAMGLHALTNYGALMLQARVLTGNQTEVWLAVVSVATIAAALWLRARSGASGASGGPPAPPAVSAEPPAIVETPPPSA